MVKERNRFKNPLKEKLNDYRCLMLTLDEILEFIYSIDPKFEKKMLALQNESKPKARRRRKPRRVQKKKGGE